MACEPIRVTRDVAEKDTTLIRLYNDSHVNYAILMCLCV